LPFEPILPVFHHVSPCYAYRDQHEGESPEAYARRLAHELDQCIESLGPGNVMAFIAEPVVGATLGAVPAVETYFEQIRAVCSRHGILLILDEVMCGMGRTGSLFATAQEGIEADLICVAKGLGAGYQPIGATLVSKSIHDAIQTGSGFFQHGHTYIGHATACAAALAVQQAVEDRGLLDRVASQGEKLTKRLTDRIGDHPHIGDIRGRGLLRGIEIVQDRASKSPFPSTLRVHARVKQAAMSEGLMCYPMGGTVDGKNGDHILLAPPFIIEDDQIDELTDKLERAVASVV
jgi:adenosylmethionine-8-amino-7-oxononanoate aminotransferase